MSEESDNDDFYQVQQILKKKSTKTGDMYLVRWKNYPNPKDFTWEPLLHLEYVKDLVEKFNQKNHSKNEQTVKNKTETIKSKISSIVKAAQPINSSKESKPKTIIVTPEKQKKIKKKNKKNELAIDENKIEEESEGQQQNNNITSQMTEITKDEIAHINHHIIKNGKIYYDIDLINEKGNIMGTHLLSSMEMQAKCPLKLIDYAQEYIIEVEEIYRSQKYG